MNLPDPLTDCFAAANTDDAERIASFFAEDASVLDEKRNHVGRAAIRQWARDVRSKTSFQSSVFKVDGDLERPLVSAYVTGDFACSPIDLTYQFEILHGEITLLSIV